MERPSPQWKRLLPFVFVFLAWATVSVWLRHETVIVSYDVSQKREEIKHLEEMNLKLKTKLEQLQSPARLEQLAKRKFQLDRPKKEQVILVEDEFEGI